MLTHFSLHLSGCNVAYLPAEDAWLVPEGEDELHPENYGFQVFRASDGTLLRSMPASEPWDIATLAFNPLDGHVYGVATQPLTNMTSTPYIVRVDVLSGETSVVSPPLGPAGPYPASGIFSDTEPCLAVVGTSAAGKGTLMFVNNRMHLSPWHRMQEVVSYDVASQALHVLQYPFGILSALTAWRNASSGRDLLLAMQWPAVAGGGDDLTPSLVAVDPTETLWAPRLLWKFDSVSLPMPNCMAVGPDGALYGLLQGADCPPSCFMEQHLLRVDLATGNATTAFYGSMPLFDPPLFSSCRVKG